MSLWGLSPQTTNTARFWWTLRLSRTGRHGRSGLCKPGMHLLGLMARVRGALLCCPRSARALSCEATAQLATTQASGPAVKMDGANSPDGVVLRATPSASSAVTESPRAQSSNAGRARKRGDACGGGGRMLPGSGHQAAGSSSQEALSARRNAQLCLRKS